MGRALLLLLAAACAAPREAPRSPPPPHRSPVVRVKTWGTRTSPDGRAVLRVVTGSGFLIDPAGLVVTCEHVLALRGFDARHAAVTVDPDSGQEETYAAEIARFDPGGDLALLVLRTDGRAFPALPLGDLATLGPGLPVRMPGYPEPGAFAEVSGRVARLWEPEPDGTVKGRLEIDAPVGRGQSGGPVLAEDGRVLGVVVARGLTSRGEQFSLAVPVDYLRRRLSQWTDVR